MKEKKHWFRFAFIGIILLIVQQIYVLYSASNNNSKFSSYHRTSTQAYSPGNELPENKVEYASPVQPPIKKPFSKKVVVCEWIGDDRMSHFAHAAQKIFACWSFLQNLPYIPKKCYAYVSSDNKSFFMQPWTMFMLSHLDCILVREKPTVFDIYTTFGPFNIKPIMPISHDGRFSYDHFFNFIDVEGSYKRISKITWFENKAHVRSFQQKVLGSAAGNNNDNENNLRNTFSGNQLRIGLIQRPKSRAFTNFDNLTIIVARNYPDAQISVSDMESKKPIEQAQWFSNQDIIIAAHGAAITNAAFISECTVVFQAYPKLFFLGFYFEPLVEIAGGINYYYYNGTDPHQEMSDLGETTPAQRYEQRELLLYLPEDFFASALEAMITKRRECLLVLSFKTSTFNVR